MSILGFRANFSAFFEKNLRQTIDSIVTDSPSFLVAAGKHVFFVILLGVAASCAGIITDVPAQVTIMTFNVENLFDNKDDPGKNDETYLPIAAKQTDDHVSGCAGIEVDRWRDQCLYWDWNDEIVDRKLTVIAKTILQFNGGRGPDILALEEVENLSILERLRTGYLQAAGYRPAVLIEGKDSRGIDVAFLSRFETVGSPRLHQIPFSGFPGERLADTRGILEATFRLPGGERLTGYAVHFPAPYHPTEMREQAYEFLNALREKLPPGRLAFAAGDFNTTSAEIAKRDMLGRFVEPQWVVAHELGCGGCPGTHYYSRDDSWSFLDMILWSRPAQSGAETTWSPVPDSVRLVNGTPEQVTDDGTPARFQLPDGEGVSDHWPLAVTIERN